jgi:hypothetical protein
VKGVVDANPSWLAAHPTDIDDPVSHDSFDFLVNVRPDAAYSGLLGTGNFAADGEETGRLHTEWEEAAYLPFAWPEPGDRVELLGSWVWDCGHWSGGGERTELHPLRAVWVQRRGVSPRSATGETEGDLLISTDKTPAGVSADCAHRAKADSAAFKACLAAEQNWQDASGTYRFGLVAPPRPGPGAKLRVRIVDAGSTPGAPAVRIVPGSRSPSVSVTVVTPAGKRVVVAKEIFVGWDRGPRPDRVRIRFERILVRRGMDPGCPPTAPHCALPGSTRAGQISRPPGEWVLYSDVAGVWTRWRLLRPFDGQTIRLGRTVDVYVAARQPWRVLVTGRECDNGSLSADSVIVPPSPCPVGTGEFLDLVGDDSPGTVVQGYASPQAAAGDHAVDSHNDHSSCPAVNLQGCYRVTYMITVVR